MTVSYTASVATSTHLFCFLKLLLRWRASIYKLIWMELLLFLGLYYVLSLTYYFLLDDDGKYVFESIVYYCNSQVSLIPLSFVLGFYVSVVMERWWKQYTTIPWPDAIAVYVSALVRGQDERGRKMRRTIMRYTCLSLTMMLTMISPGVKKRFPTMDHLIDAGLLAESEKQIISGINEKFPKHPTHWMPIVWAASIVTRARKEGRIWDDFSLRTIIDELNKFRGKCGSLLHYDWISIPLVYTQVVILAVYTYFLGAVFGNQWTAKQDNEGYFNIVDQYFPIFPTLQFFFYMGWLKVAESLINPFGENDDDFEVNWLIDRNLQVSYLIVDDMHHEHPDLVKDQYWNEVLPDKLPYPEKVEIAHEEPPEHSTAKLDPKPSAAASRINIWDVEEGVSFRRASSIGFVSSIYRGLDRLGASLRRLSHLQPHDMMSSRTHLSITSNTSFNSNSEIKLRTTLYDQVTDDFLGEKVTMTEETDGKDAFEKLKEEREQQRSQRQQRHAAYGIHSQAVSRTVSFANLREDTQVEDEDEDEKESDVDDRVDKNNKKQ